MKSLVLICLVALGLTPAWAQFIDIRISAKIIVNPTSGVPPSGISNEVFYAAADRANEWQARYQRGYRFRVTEVTEIGGPSEGGTNGPSKWFNQVFRTGDPWKQFYAEAQSDSRYRLRADQINVYVATRFDHESGGAMPIPPDMMETGGQIFVDDGPWWIGHELGHFFGLRHPHADENASNCTPGDDGLSDTPPDSTCWTNKDMVANYYYPGMTYGALTGDKKLYVDTLYENVMSYHDPLHKNETEDGMTEMQLDLFAETANTHRRPFVTGMTLFVDRSSTCVFQTGHADCDGWRLQGPFQRVTDGVNAASSAGTDMVVIRPGNYNERTTFTRPATLRATRKGPVTLGRP